MYFAFAVLSATVEEVKSTKVSPLMSQQPTGVVAFVSVAIWLLFFSGGVLKSVSSASTFWPNIAAFAELTLALFLSVRGFSRGSWTIPFATLSMFLAVHLFQFFGWVESCNCFGKWTSKSGQIEFTIVSVSLASVWVVRKSLIETANLPFKFVLVLASVVALGYLFITNLPRSKSADVRLRNSVDGVLAFTPESVGTQVVSVEIENVSNSTRRIVGAKMDCSCSTASLPVTIGSLSRKSVELTTNVPELDEGINSFDRKVCFVLDDEAFKQC